MKRYQISNKVKACLAGMAAVAVLSLDSCSKFTELDPLASLSESTAFTTPENIDLAANGVYQAAAIGFYEGGAGRGYPFGAASTQQGEMRGEDMINLQQFFAITYESAPTVVSANNKNHWEQLYALINQANVLIDGVRGAAEEGIIESSVATVYEAEGRFLRALSHHELLIHFCRPYADGNGSHPGVPYRTIGITLIPHVEEGLALGRGTVAEAYQNVLADLDFAEANLPATNATNRIARATSGAAIALKTRVKLHMADYPGVIAEATKLGADATSGSFLSPVGAYRLEALPETPFRNQSNNAESIFSIANSDVSHGGVNGALANMMGPSALGGRDLIATSPNLYNASFWVDGDLRRENLQYRQSGGDYQLVFNTKYDDYGVFGDWNPILRYAEVLLNAAEAYAREGNDDQALRLLNAVRDRSVPASESFGTTPPSDLILAILNERRIEFTGEGRRWPDIHRLVLDADYGLGEIPAKILSVQLVDTDAPMFGLDFYDLATRPTVTPQHPAVPYDDFKFIWPIPQSETNANPTLREQQNPGY